MTLEEALASLEENEGLDIGWQDVWIDLLLFWGGWALCAALMLALIGHLMLVLMQKWRRWRQRKHKKQLQWLLQELQRVKQAPHSDIQKIAAINQLLKQAAIVAGYRRETAGLSGERWLAWLQQFDVAKSVQSPESEQWQCLLYAPPHKAQEAGVPGGVYGWAEQIARHIIRSGRKHV